MGDVKLYKEPIMALEGDGSRMARLSDATKNRVAVGIYLHASFWLWLWLCPLIFTVLTRQVCCGTKSLSPSYVTLRWALISWVYQLYQLYPF